MNPMFRHKTRERAALLLGDSRRLGNITTGLVQHFLDVFTFELSDQAVFFVAETAQG